MDRSSARDTPLTKVYQVKIFKSASSRLSVILKSTEFKVSNVNLPKRPHVLLYSNGLAIYHGLPNIGQGKVNNGR